MPNCYECDSHVSDNFARVFSDENGIIWACPSCSSQAGIAESAKENRLKHRQRNNNSQPNSM